MPTSERPHILLITADELRKDALSCYGAEAVQTPHTDRLAQHGTQFQSAYANSPLCLPSRCSLLTGLHPHNSRAYSNFRPCALNPSLPNLYNQLRGGGYTTAHVGKCHFTPAPYSKTSKDATLDLEKVKDFYMSLGLDHLDLQNGKNNSVYWWNDYSRELEAAGYLSEYRRLAWAKQETGRVFPFPGPDEWHPDAWVGRKAVEWIGARSALQPQFLWVSFSGPHYPFDAPASYYDRVDESRVGVGIFQEGEFDEKQKKIQAPAYLGGGEKMGLAEGKNSAPGFACKNYDDAYWRRLRRAYFANVALIDDWVGRITASARAALGDNLMVIFTADHGDMLGNHRLWGKNSCTYEDILNVPLLVQFPGQTQAAPTGARVMLTDIMPTCLNAAGVKLPPPECDGRDLHLSIQDGGHPFVLSSNEGLLTISDGRYKYTQYDQNGRSLCEAYDLQADPHEFNNIIAQPKYAPEISRLRALLVGVFMKDFLR